MKMLYYSSRLFIFVSCFHSFHFSGLFGGGEEEGEKGEINVRIRIERNWNRNTFFLKKCLISDRAVFLKLEFTSLSSSFLYISDQKAWSLW
jgi:hypothetical protein